MSDFRKKVREDLIANHVIVELKPCPFCNFQPDLKDDDFIYPVTHDRLVYSLNCYETGGGCGASVLGRSSEECLEKWNTRHD